MQIVLKTSQDDNLKYLSQVTLLKKAIETHAEEQEIFAGKHEAIVNQMELQAEEWDFELAEKNEKIMELEERLKDELFKSANLQAELDKKLKTIKNIEEENEDVKDELSLLEAQIEELKIKYEEDVDEADNQIEAQSGYAEVLQTHIDSQKNEIAKLNELITHLGDKYQAVMLNKLAGITDMKAEMASKSIAFNRMKK